MARWLRFRPPMADESNDQRFPEAPLPPSDRTESPALGSVSENASWPAPEDPIATEKGSLAWRALGLLRTIRPHQWVKNVFVLAPVVFAKEIFAPELLIRAGSAFFAFCLLAGAVYTMNDLADVDADREHPVKRHRPIASGRVPESVARCFSLLLVVLSLGGGVALGWQFALWSRWG